MLLGRNLVHSYKGQSIYVRAMQGLENEYDRLLSENDELKRRLSRFDASSPYTANNKKGA